MNTPHKWAEVIKAWADGAEIQCRVANSHLSTTWHSYKGLNDIPSWNQTILEFRVKPEKSAGQVYFETNYGHTWERVSQEMKGLYNKGAEAVINAYKAGEINEV